MRFLLFGIFALSMAAGPITITPTQEDLLTVSSTIDIPGVGDTMFQGACCLILTTNTDHIISILSGGTLDNVGDSVNLPIELTGLDLASSHGTLTTAGTEPIGSMTFTYTRSNEGGTFTGTLPVVLSYSAGHIVFDDTLTIKGDWSVVPVVWGLTNGIYIGDKGGQRELFTEVGADVDDVAYVAGPEPATAGLLGISTLALAVLLRKRAL